MGDKIHIIRSLQKNQNRPPSREAGGVGRKKEVKRPVTVGFSLPHVAFENCPFKIFVSFPFLPFNKKKKITISLISSFSSTTNTTVIDDFSSLLEIIR